MRSRTEHALRKIHVMAPLRLWAQLNTFSIRFGFSQKSPFNKQRVRPLRRRTLGPPGGSEGWRMGAPSLRGPASRQRSGTTDDAPLVRLFIEECAINWTRTSTSVATGEVR